MDHSSTELPFLRQGSTGDLPALLQLEKTCFVGDYAPHRFRSADFLAYLRNPSALFQLARADGELVGYVAGVIRRKGGEPNTRLDSIAVLPAWRRRGVGRQLLNWFLEESRRRQADRVTLEVLASNEAGRRWFAQASFREGRRLPNYYAAGVDGIELSRDLGE